MIQSLKYRITPTGLSKNIMKANRVLKSCNTNLSLVGVTFNYFLGVKGANDWFCVSGIEDYGF